jgi:hypothetical protein
MACCAPATSPGSGAAATDSCKRVNYTLGMLMGVDDFVQEQVYNGSRRRELAREVLGYGTVHGLDVVVEADGDKGPRLRVTPGMAWLPSGTPVCVDSDQCANLNDWLSANAAAVQGAMASSPPAISLYVVLSHVQCLTDNVPIPGEPCRSDDELMQPSRIADGFRLDLRLSPPLQREEDALRDFVQWLLGLPLVQTSPPLDEATFVEQLRAAAHDWLSPSSPPTSPPGSPPDYMTGVAPAGTDESLFRTALRLWVTELRPLWMARADCSCSAPPIPPLDDVVLLAQLDLSLVATTSGGDWQVSDQSSAVVIDESRRPILLTLRMVQELILLHHEIEPGPTVVPETGFGQAPDAGTALSYSRSDHTHGSPSLPALGGDLSGPLDDARIESLQGIPLAAASPFSDGQVLTLEGGQWVPMDLPAAPAPVLPPLTGDVAGPIGANQIGSLQGKPLSVSSPIAGQVLSFVGGTWVASDLPAPAPPPPPPVIPPLTGDVAGPIGANQIGSLQGKPLSIPSPTAGQVLSFVGGTWVAADLPAPAPPAPTPAPAPAGQFVERNGARYQIAAAGEIRIVVVDAQPTSTMRPSPGYGKLDGQAVAVNATEPSHMLVRFRAAVPGADKLPNYITQLTPIWTEGTKIGFRLYLEDAIKAGGDGIDFQVRVVADASIIKGTVPVAFQVEVSRF